MVNGINAVDIVAWLWLLLGLWHGVRQGLAVALLRLLAVGLAIGGGLLGYAWLGEKISGLTRMGMMLKTSVTFAFKGRLETVGGGLVGLLVSMCIVTLLLLLAGQWPHPLMRKWFAEESWSGHLVAEQLGPTWQRLEQRYPALRLPAGTTPEPLETTVQDVKADTTQATDKAGQSVEKKAKKAKKRVSDAVVEGTKQ